MRPPECGNIFLLAVTNCVDGTNLVSQRHNVVNGKVAASDATAVRHSCAPALGASSVACETPHAGCDAVPWPQVLNEVNHRQRDRPGEDFQFEGRGVPAGVKVYVSSDRSFAFTGALCLPHLSSPPNYAAALTWPVYVVVADVRYPDRCASSLCARIVSC